MTIQVKPIEEDQPVRLVDWWATHAVKAMGRMQARIVALEERVAALEKSAKEEPQA